MSRPDFSEYDREFIRHIDECIEEFDRYRVKYLFLNRKLSLGFTETIYRLKKEKEQREKDIERQDNIHIKH